ncbi:DUF4314 domain-containing protein [Candidatus Pseudoruminococcus sp.]|uniref:DUF4314 domain-containing protein n=1 Tax=Candidatus Pseudoruminococcus sp. TaxID=3101048 RepID=UPI00399A2982
MKYPGRDIIEKLKQQYPVGTRVILRKMDDCQAPPIGTKGTVQGVDDAASLLVKWDNGCGLNVVYGVDEVENLDSVTTVCYGEEKLWDCRKEAKDFFLEALKATEGSERERYATIYTKLILGKNYCTDELD